MPTKEYKINHSLRPGGGGDPDRVFPIDRSTDRDPRERGPVIDGRTDGRTADTNGSKLNEFHFATSFASVDRDRVAKERKHTRRSSREKKESETRSRAAD